MGLGMYLTAKRFLWSNEEQFKKSIAAIFPDVPGAPSHIEYEVAYWRKANHIHAWFVKNVQNGVDDCKRYYVSRKQLTELVDTCKKVLANPKKANTLLPTQSGFFIGGVEYDQGYLDDLQYTIGALTKVVDPMIYKGWDFEYHSSW